MAEAKIKLNPTRSQEKILKSFVLNSKIVYNAAMKENEEYHNENGKFITYTTLNSKLRGTEEYKLLPSHSARRIIRLANRDFKLKKAGKYNPDKKFDNPLNNTYKLLFDNERVKVEDGFITLGGSKYYQSKFGKEKLKFKLNLLDIKKHREVVLEPYGNGLYFRLHLKYDVLPRKKQTKKSEDGITYEKFKSFEVGHLYHFNYIPKYKDTLSFYDGKPLMFFIGVNKYRNLLGLNIHFLPMKFRKKIMKEIKFRSDGKAYDGSLIKGLSVIKRFFPLIIRSYIPNRARNISTIPMIKQNMDSVEDFPTAKYYKKTSDEIFKIILSESGKKR